MLDSCPYPRALVRLEHKNAFSKYPETGGLSYALQRSACVSIRKCPETGGLAYALQRSSMQHAHHIARLVRFVCGMRCKAAACCFTCFTYCVAYTVVCVARQQHAALLALLAPLLALTARPAAFTYILLLYLLLYCFTNTYGTRVRRCPHPELRISALLTALLLY
jgi:hypothetical protein